MQLGIKTSANLNSSCHPENPKQSDWFVGKLRKTIG